MGRGRRRGSRAAPLRWWAIGHTANLKIDAGFVKSPQRPMRDSSFVLTLQAQLYL
jgi:hypothetical protein